MYSATCVVCRDFGRDLSTRVEVGQGQTPARENAKSAATEQSYFEAIDTFLRAPVRLWFAPMCRPTRALIHRPFFWARVHLFLCLIAFAALVAGCGETDSPEAQVRAAIDQIELAAEARDVGDVLEHVSPHYRDHHGNDRDGVGRALRGYFIANQSIHLLTRIEELSFPAEDEARATVVVGMVGRDAAAENAWNLAADVYSFDVVLVREDQEWKVTWARRQRG